VRADLLAVLLLLLLPAAACDQNLTKVREEARMLTGGDPDKGPSAIGRYGCGACHTIPGVRGATGTVGPPLAGIAARGYLAGRLSNSPSNMKDWIQHPQAIAPGTAMPEMRVTDEDATHITAFLYTLR
jgi:cytochrome c2